MATINSLKDDLVRRIVLHVFNKHRADVVGKDGLPKPSKKKFSLTSSQLLSEYNMDIDATFLKNHNVSILV